MGGYRNDPVGQARSDMVMVRGKVGEAEDWTRRLSLEQDKGVLGGWRQLGRRGANGTSCTHSANKSCLFAQAVGGRFWPLNTDPRGPELPQFPLRKTLPKS